MSEGQIITYKSGIPTYVNKILNSNFPNVITSLPDSTGSTGTAGDVLQKNDPSNDLIWATPNFVSPNKIIVSRSDPYNLPTALANIVFDISAVAHNYSLFAGVVSLNNTSSEDIRADFFLSATVSDSSTRFRFYITVSGSNIATCQSRRTQSSVANGYVLVNISTMTTVSSSGTVSVRCERSSGSGTMSINTDAGGTSTPYACSLLVTRV